MKNKGLGKGLAALIGEQNLATNKSNNGELVRTIPIIDISPNEFQPRKIFNNESISDLADSIIEHGVIQPIIVTKIIGTQNYKIVAGERRWRAAQIAGLTEIQAIVRDVVGSDLAEKALIENIQREDLNPVDEAKAYMDLVSKHGYTQEKLAKSLGKNRSHIANMIRIALLPDEVKNYIIAGKISFSHAKVIAGNEKAIELADEIVAKGLNVRQTEHLVKTWSDNKQNLIKAPTNKQNKVVDNDDYKNIADDLTEKLGLRCTIEPNGTRGKIVINYNNFVQLDTIIGLLSASSTSGENK
jgi:ParB family chromosome partitioning protein